MLGGGDAEDEEETCSGFESNEDVVYSSPAGMVRSASEEALPVRLFVCEAPSAREVSLHAQHLHAKSGLSCPVKPIRKTVGPPPWALPKVPPPALFPDTDTDSSKNEQQAVQVHKSASTTPTKTIFIANEKRIFSVSPVSAPVSSSALSPFDSPSSSAYQPFTSTAPRPASGLTATSDQLLYTSTAIVTKSAGPYGPAAAHYSTAAPADPATVTAAAKYQQHQQYEHQSAAGHQHQQQQQQWRGWQWDEDSDAISAPAAIPALIAPPQQPSSGRKTLKRRPRKKYPEYKV